MNDTLKAAGRIGAELGAAKAEVERLSHKLERARDHLTHARHDVEIRANAGNDAARLVLKGIDQWLSDYDQSPDDTYTAVDMATAAAQGFRDGQAAAEQAPAQDELDPIEKAALDARLRRDFEARWPVPKGVIWGAAVGDYCLSEFAQGIALSYPDMWMAYKAGSERGKSMKYVPECLRNLPPQKSKSADSKRRKSARDIAGMTIAQTEQRPVRLPQRKNLDGLLDPASKRAGMAYNEALEDVELLNTPPIAQTAPQHPDDAAVDRFAAAMKAKLAKSRAKGRGGWDDPNVCSVEFLAQLLVEHLGKGNAGTFEDVANFAMMLHQRGADPMVLANATRPAQTEQQPVATWMGTDWNAQQQLIAHLCKLEPGTDLYAAPIAQAAKRGEA